MTTRESATTTSGSGLTRGYTVALLAAAILSTTSIFIRYLTQTYGMPPLVLAFWRDALAVLALLPALGLLRPALLKPRRQHLPYLFAYGFLLATFNGLYTLSVALNGAAVATVLVYSSVAFTALLGRLIQRESLDWGKLLAVGVSLAGCALVSGALDAASWRGNLLGILTGALSGLGYAIYTLMGRSAARRGLNTWTALLYTFGFATVFLAFANLLSAGLLPGAATRPSDFLWLGGSPLAWGVLFLLAAGPTVAGYGLYNMSLGYLPSSVANLVVSLQPAFTAAIAWFLLGERLDGPQMVGGLMILAGVAFLRVREGRRASLAERSGTSPAAAGESGATPPRGREQEG